MRLYASGMTDQPKPQGTARIVIGAVLLVLALLQLVTMPGELESGEAASIGGKIFGLVLFAGIGTWVLVSGINQRKASTRA